MMVQKSDKTLSRTPPWGVVLSPAASWLRDLPVILAGLGLFYGLLSFAHYWTGPINRALGD